jgi:cell division initiation protein
LVDSLRRRERPAEATHAHHTPRRSQPPVPDPILRVRSVIKLEAKISDLAANESILQETLTTAQRLSEDLKRTAVKEAEVRVGEAEVKAEKILGAAHRRAAKLAEDIREMKQLRTRLAASLRAAIEAHMGLLEGLSAEDPDDPILEGKVSYLTRPAKEAKSGGEG